MRTKFLFTVVFFLILFSGFTAASTLAKLEVVILAPGMKETISVNLNEEFSLNGKIRQKALLTGYDDVYDNLVIELSDIKEEGVPEADLRISALKTGVPVTLGLSDMRARNEENVFGVRIKLLDFVRDGDGYIGAKFLVEKESKTWSEFFVEFIRALLFD
ncbi:MAG: hypothetical protein KAT37_01215 [Candidatus Aenigmarchaeota archaeon]|nr:hypothetical protein [Candidatus Aenigmarchaeota archaeon]